VGDIQKTAFVLMRFTDDPWRDPTYKVVREVLRESGYTAIRADEIETAGPVVDEVLRLLREADCVVFDTTGDSSNVAYELGYCHGEGRSNGSLILLRKAGDAPAFNYQHYRHSVYTDLRHLRRLLRYRLRLSTPLTDDQLGYAFTMSLPDESLGWYGLDVVESILSGLESLKFTGRCEYYAVDYFQLKPRLYCVGVGLKPEDQANVTRQYWEKLRNLFAQELNKSNSKLVFDRHLSEYAEMRSFRQGFIPGGTAEFKDGLPVRLLNMEDVDSTFAGSVRERLGILE